MKILHIDTSIREDRSVSRELTKYALDLITKGTDITVDRLDLNAERPAHITQGFLDVQRTDKAKLTLGQRALIAESDSLIERLKDANLYIIGLPMYNFTFPSSFKTFLDNVMISGKTFGSSENGAFGMLKEKKALVISSRGATYDSPETSAYDCLEPLVRAALGYIGILEVEMLNVEATVFFGEERKNQSIAKARKDIQMIVDRFKSESL